MKEILKFLPLLFVTPTSLACNPNNMITYQTKDDETIINEDNSSTIEDIKEENKELTNEQKYIKKYYEFYQNYITNKDKLLNVDITGTIDNKEFTVNTIYVDVLNRVEIQFACGDKTFDLVGAGMEWDVTTAYLESFITRLGNPSYVINDNEIECSTTKPGLEGEITNLSFYNTGYIKKLKATLYYESFKVAYDLEFNNWRE